MDNGETIVELGTADSYYFQIKWKIAPSSREFVKVKNICKINCTEHGKFEKNQVYFNPKHLPQFYFPQVTV